jgi:hypothetical protein
MMPAAFVTLKRMPVTPNGKLNRRALPAPDPDAYVSREYQAPQSAVEQRLALIWMSLLPTATIGRNHDFFESGGNSLLVMRLIVTVAKEFTIPFSAQAVFKHPTLAAMAQIISSELLRERQQSAEPLELQEGVL